MDISSSQSPELDMKTRDLQCLLEDFSSNCSLEDIASAYCRENGDVNATGEILYDFGRGKQSSGAEVRSDVVEHAPSQCSFGHDKPCSLARNDRGYKPKKFLVSSGTVSSVVRNGTSQHQPYLPGVIKTAGTSKLELKQPELKVNATTTDLRYDKMPLHNKEIEDFLFSMLHEGFNLDMDKIQKVLCSCGYNGKKPNKKCLGVKPHLKESQETYSRVVDSHREFPKSSQPEDEKSKISLEVLEALFADRKGLDDPPKRACLKTRHNRTRAAGKKVVSAPFSDDDSIVAIDFPKPQNSNDGNGEKIDALRRDSKQHWESMKEFYAAAFDAFAQGEKQEKIDYLLEQGKYHNKMARETDELATQVITEKRIKPFDAFTLNLHSHHTKEARSLLKSHLRSLAGTARFLRVIIDSNAEDITNGRRRVAVIDFLKREQIQWSEEEGNPGTILIQMER